MGILCWLNQAAVERWLCLCLDVDVCLPVVFSLLTASVIPGHTAQTLQLNRKKAGSGARATYNSLQRHSSGGNLDYDNVENCSGPALATNGRCGRSRTLGDGLGECSQSVNEKIGCKLSIWVKLYQLSDVFKTWAT